MKNRSSLMGERGQKKELKKVKMVDAFSIQE
jgi:hypothetical protein